VTTGRSRTPISKTGRNQGSRIDAAIATSFNSLIVLIMDAPQSDSIQASEHGHSRNLTEAQRQQRLREIVHVFLKLGMTAFGGPTAHIAMMDDEVVKRRAWMPRERLLDLLGVTNLIPGPNSTELAIQVGYERAGVWGLILAGVSFILPAMLLVWGLAIAYVHYQTLPQLNWLLYGIKPVIIAIVVQALWKLGRKAVKDIATTVAAVVVMVAFFLGINEIVLLLLAGLGVMVLKNRFSTHQFHSFVVPSLLLSVQSPLTTATWLQVFLFFLKVGSVLYGGGYVLFAFLQRDLVERSHWLTSQQLLDAIAIGQVTPGPLLTTATFVGYLLAGHTGAIAGTLGIFLPSFILVFAINPWVAKLRSSTWASGFLDGVNAASMGLMAVVAISLGQTALVDGLTLALALGSIILLVGFNLNSLWLVIAGGIAGFFIKFLF
jgi:chromate transporter